MIRTGNYKSELLGTCSLTLNKFLTLHLCQLNHLLYVYNNAYQSFRITIKFSLCMYAKKTTNK